VKRPRTLRSRIVLFFCGYLAVLLIIYSYSLIGSFRIAEDLTFTRQLSEVLASTLKHIETHGELPEALPMRFSAFTDLTDVPTYLREHVEDREPGIFETWGEDWSVHVAIAPLDSTGKKLFVFYDVGSIETSEWLESMAELFLAVLGGGVLLLGWVLARSLANRIITPVTELASAVRELPLDEDSATLRYNPTPDEIGTLGNTIDHLLRRISEFTRREREFTAHASHELRTPVTVIKGALEILKGRSDAGKASVQRPLARIERAVTDMERLIDTFLMLARQKPVSNEGDACDLRGVVENVVATHHYLLATKPVEVQVLAADAGSIKAPASLVTIALGNLVRNAFQYTMEGKIVIIALPDRVRITDSGPGISASGVKGNGLGLTIVDRLCEHMDWKFAITSKPGEGTRAELIFTGEAAKD
jgi:signal transduction histidine kinase